MATEMLSSFSSSVVKETTVNFSRKTSIVPVELSQYDDSEDGTLVCIKITMYKGNSLYEPPSNVTVRIRFGMFGGYFAYYPALGFLGSRSVVIIPVRLQMTLIYGDFQPEIEVVTEDGSTVASAPFNLKINKAAVQQSYMASWLNNSEEFGFLEEYKEAAERSAASAGRSATSASASAESAAASAESASSSVITARASAESALESASSANESANAANTSARSSENNALSASNSQIAAANSADEAEESARKAKISEENASAIAGVEVFTGSGPGLTPGVHSWDAENGRNKFLHLTGAWKDPLQIGKKDGTTAPESAVCEGTDVVATATNSHAEGRESTAAGINSHAEGSYSMATGTNSHAEGFETTSTGNASHAEGNSTLTNSSNSHAEGSATRANGTNSHAEGLGTTAKGNASHAEGNSTSASSENSHTEGYSTTTTGSYAHAEGTSTIASGSASHAEGSSASASGDYSHAEGNATIADRESSHAEGNATKAAGNYSHAEGSSTTASGSASHAEGNATSASGNYSHAEGDSTKASGNCSHAEGSGTLAIAYSHAEGSSTSASGAYSHAEGASAYAVGSYSHAEGSDTSAIGGSSHAEGSRTSANGLCSHAGGRSTISDKSYMTAIGSYNKKDAHTSNTRFVIGKGSSDTDRSNCFRVETNGVYAAGAYNASGADYAELFEWSDSNAESEDRIGKFVTLTGDKIRLATDADSYILGVVSANPSVVGDVFSDQWHGMYETDVFGRIIFEEVEVEAVTEERNGETIEVIPAHTENLPKINPDYDYERGYTARTNRPEWDAVGLIGKLVVLDDGTCTIDGWAKVSALSIATASDDVTRYRVIKRLDESHIVICIN